MKVKKQKRAIAPWEHILAIDPYLKPYAHHIQKRFEKIRDTEKRLTGGRVPLADFASGHEYYGLHFQEGKWVFREWAPNATAIYILGDMNGWQPHANYALRPIGHTGDWEIRLPAEALHHEALYRLRVEWEGGGGDRIPAYARRVVQDAGTLIFNAQVWCPPVPFQWRHDNWRADTPLILNRKAPPLIYEAHTGMAQETEEVGTYAAFMENVLPRIKAAGYNTLQLMAVQEHPYYGSFGYHVSNFFAPSSRFGTPDELRALVDAAHGQGLAVIMDIVHSHAVNNEIEGLSRFDGTLHQYFHGGDRGKHVAWDSRCFDYGKLQVLHFLLSNCRYWLDAFHFDGFRFDGITSMLYLHHGLGTAFTDYGDYFNTLVDTDALVYLALANKLIHDVRPDAVTVAEDISGMPGLASSQDIGGFGFDYRLAMGVPDYWIKLVKEIRDEDWPMGALWYELNNRRREEKSISYTESHDQALVGDQTLIFRLIGADMYNHMHRDDPHMGVDRGIALHKMIRLVTIATGGNGYLNFMGNEFGHPEWIDFPREGNGWSYRYARRQWSLKDNPDLKYHFLAAFDQAMLDCIKQHQVLADAHIRLHHEHTDNKVLIFERANLLFAFNFHPTRSYTDYAVSVPPGAYQMILDTDAAVFGGHKRLTSGQKHITQPCKPGSDYHSLQLYLPTRTGIVLQRNADLERDRIDG